MPGSFRALRYVKTYATNVMSMAGGSAVAVTPLALGDHPRQLKNIRGEFQFSTADQTPTSVDAAAGWIALCRWPGVEQLGTGDVDLQDPRILHPVTWNFRLYPGHVHYEFKGINLSEADKLYLVVHKGLHSGNDAVYVDWVLLWAQLNLPAVAP